mmetsp:Transcript_101654/g.152333  ORF Transcript_101654/g.152333 Transcript_101654/m.152333 type:complete len:225 (+) Transcript_101654:46-720(+)
MSLFVGQLSHEMHTNELKGIFEEFGRLNRCELKSGSRADFAFLTFEHERDAEDALHSLNGKEFYGLKMNVEWARGGRARSSRSEGCFECGEYGHFARNCPRKRHRYRSPSPRRRYRDSRSPPRRRRRSYSRSPSPRKYSLSPRRRSRSPRRGRSRSRSYSRSPARSYSRSPVRRRRSRSNSPRSPRKERSRERSNSPRNGGNEKRPLENPNTEEEPPEKKSKIE